MLAAKKVVRFNNWMMSLHGNDDYSDFFRFMDSSMIFNKISKGTLGNELSLITKQDSADSWYTEVDSEMFWSGIVDDEKKKE